MDISKIDKNFENTFSFEGMKMYNVNDEPFKLYGLWREEGETDFKRLPESVAMATDNNSVKSLYRCTSGVRLKFATNSKRIILRCVMPYIYSVPHMALTGSSCFDLYVDGQYHNVFRPGVDETKSATGTDSDKGFSSGFVFPDKKRREILIHFPLYNPVDEVYIYVEDDANIYAPKEYKHELPFVVYGSSITHGACASHPGNSYPAMLSREFDIDFINLGFSAGCKGELCLAEHIAKIPQSVFIYDYDANAPTLEHLKNTHEPFFKRIRQENPTLPIIIMTGHDDGAKTFGIKAIDDRREVIYKTYKNAVDAGDENVYYVDGAHHFQHVGDDLCTVDGVHPNDLGFYCMSKAAGRILGKIL